jgi:hypothetical protein
LAWLNVGGCNCGCGGGGGLNWSQCVPSVLKSAELEPADRPITAENSARLDAKFISR